MLGGIPPNTFTGMWPKQESLEKAQPKSLEVIEPRRLRAIQVLNRWKRDRDNVGEVVDFLIAELNLRGKYDGVE